MEIGSFEVGPEELGVAEVRRVQIGPREIGPRQVGVGEIAVRKIGKAHLSDPPPIPAGHVLGAASEKFKCPFSFHRRNATSRLTDRPLSCRPHSKLQDPVYHGASLRRNARALAVQLQRLVRRRTREQLGQLSSFSR